ncbi:MAG: putative nucleotide-diphospho-sugar transferase [Mangrovicoccus sp.]
MAWTTPAELAPATCGFVLACTGAKYTTAALQCARTLKETNPGFAVDIFTDQEIDSPHIDQVHELTDSWFRPKFESLINSRFDRTIYIDADTYVVADLSDVFWLLGKHDIAACHAAGRNQGFARIHWHYPLPNAFPQINGGMMGVRRSEATQRLFKSIVEGMKRDNSGGDQPIIREMLWESDLRLAILPPEYNARNTTLWRYGGSKFTAPRILHHSGFVKRIKDEKTPIAPEEIYGSRLTKHFRRLIAADRSLNPKAQGKVPAPQFNNIFVRARDGLAGLLKGKKS